MHPFNKAQAKENFEQTAENVNLDDIKNAAESGTEKLNGLAENIPKSLIECWNDLKLMIALLKDYFSGNYTTVPWKVIAAITSAVLYFVSPIDLIPDLIPIIGFIDDAFVISMCISLCRSDLQNYTKFRTENKLHEEAVNE